MLFPQSQLLLRNLNDLQGKVLKRLDVSASENTRISVADLSTGVYLLCDGKGGALKFVKQ